MSAGDAGGFPFEPEIAGVNIVLMGHFNPAIFTPAWFGLTGLLPKRAAEKAALGVAHAQRTEFEAEWLDFQVTTSHLLASTSQAPYGRLSDLVVSLFRDTLPHTPLLALGINRYVHFRVRNLAERDRIGRTLAPVDCWGDWSRDLGDDGHRGGMTSLTMSQVAPARRPNTDQINARVERSNVIEDKETGVFVQVNDHYGAEDERSAGPYLTGILKDGFEASLRHSDSIIGQVMSLAS